MLLGNINSIKGNVTIFVHRKSVIVLLAMTMKNASFQKYI